MTNLEREHDLDYVYAVLLIVLFLLHTVAPLTAPRNLL